MGACVLPVVIDVSVLRRLQEKGHLYIMKCSSPSTVTGSNNKQSIVEGRQDLVSIHSLRFIFKSPSSDSEAQIFTAQQRKRDSCELHMNWIECPCPRHSVQVQNLLPGQRSGLVPADTPPLALQWTCCVAHPAAARGSSVLERGGKKTDCQRRDNFSLIS